MSGALGRFCCRGVLRDIAELVGDTSMPDSMVALRIAFGVVTGVTGGRFGGAKLGGGAGDGRVRIVPIPFLEDSRRSFALTPM